MFFVPFDPEKFCFTVLAKREGRALIELLAGGGGGGWGVGGGGWSGFFQGGCGFSERNFQLLMKYRIR